MSENRDVVLVTVDCWRHDAVDRMQGLREWSADEDVVQTDAICQSSATNGVFPSILSSTHYFEAYNQAGGLSDDVVPLAEVLSDAGYTTGGFVASNPHLQKWAGSFNHFRNGTLSDVGDGADDGPDTSLGQYASDLLALQKRVPGRRLLKRALEWYRDQSGPRFLWLHLMDPHTPYHPGIRKATDVGLVRSYLAAVRFLVALKRNMRTFDDLHPLWKRQLERMHWACVENVDRTLADALPQVDDDATVVLMGDHGENLEEDPFRHGKLYDTQVRVPLFVRWTLDHDFGEPASVRQMDLAPTIAEAVTGTTPSAWEGAPLPQEAPRPSNTVHHASRLDRVFVGHRTDCGKLIANLDFDTGIEQDREYYDLQDDPIETNNRYGTGEDVPPEMESALDDFVERVQSGSSFAESGSGGEAATKRLKELGYLS